MGWVEMETQEGIEEEKGLNDGKLVGILYGSINFCVPKI